MLLLFTEADEGLGSKINLWNDRRAPRKRTALPCSLLGAVGCFQRKLTLHPGSLALLSDDGRVMEDAYVLEQEITNSLFYLKMNIKVTSENNELPTTELWRWKKQNKTTGFSSLLPVLHLLAPFMVVGQRGCHLVGNSEDEVGTLGRALGDCHLLSLSPWLALQMPAGTHNYILFCVCAYVVWD